MSCQDWMNASPTACLAKDSAAQAARIITQQGTGFVPVVQDFRDNRLVGVVTDRDLALKIIAEHRDPNSVTVEQVMSRNPVICRPEESAKQIIAKMMRRQVRHLPVIDKKGRLIGAVSYERALGKVGQFGLGAVSAALIAGFCVGIGAGL